MSRKIGRCFAFLLIVMALLSLPVSAITQEAESGAGSAETAISEDAETTADESDENAADDTEDDADELDWVSEVERLTIIPIDMGGLAGSPQLTTISQTNNTSGGNTDNQHTIQSDYINTWKNRMDNARPVPQEEKQNSTNTSSTQITTISQTNDTTGDRAENQHTLQSDFSNNQTTVIDNASTPVRQEGTHSASVPSQADRTGSLTASASDETAEAASGTPVVEPRKAAWYDVYIVYLAKHRMTSKLRDGLFYQDTDIERSAFAQLLYNIEQDKERAPAAFEDVDPTSPYADAINWCAKVGIVNGVAAGRFAPLQSMTRAELVTILYRFAKYKQFDVSDSATLDDFVDSERIPSWSRSAMEWAVGIGLIGGIDGRLSFDSNATGGQLTKILTCFLEYYKV